MDKDKNENWRDVLSRLEKKIDKLEDQISRIDKGVNPPWWKNFAGFLANNFFTILTLVSLCLIAWKAWEFYLDITSQLKVVKEASESLKSLPGDAGDSIKDMIKNLKF